MSNHHDKGVDGTTDLETPAPAPQLPMLFPSQLLPSQPLAVPPAHLFAEDMPVADPNYMGTASGNAGDHSATNYAPDPNFAKVANDLINASLGRVPDGMSVVEPDSILDESGRLYHGYKDGKYFLPNDAAEQDRLDVQHHSWKLILDGWLHTAPMSKVPDYVLDIATGTGIWAFEFAERFPSSRVIGTDLSAIQPKRDIPNCWFQKDDAEDEWVFPAAHPPSEPACDGPCEHRIRFDYVHMRMVCTCFNDIRTVFQRAYDNLNPGGWIEIHDESLDLQQENGTFEGSPLHKWSDGCIRGAAAQGRNIVLQKHYETWLKEAGFVETRERKLVMPNSPWAKSRKLREVGRFQLKNATDGLRGVGFKMMKAAGYSIEEIDQTVAEARDYLFDFRNHVYGTAWVVYGRKPYPGEVAR